MSSALSRQALQALNNSDFLAATPLVVRLLQEEPANPETGLLQLMLEYAMAGRVVDEAPRLPQIAQQIRARYPESSVALALTADDFKNTLRWSLDFDDVVRPNLLQLIALAARAEPATREARFRYLCYRLLGGTFDQSDEAMLDWLLALDISPAYRHRLLIAAMGYAAQTQQAAAAHAIVDRIALQPMQGAPLIELEGKIALDYRLWQEGFADSRTLPGDLSPYEALLPEIAQLYPALTPVTQDKTSGPLVTVVMTTHISPKLKRNAHKAPPEITLLAETMERFYGQLQADRSWPVQIYFDMPPSADGSPTPAAALYIERLRAWGREQQLDLQIFPCPARGLRTNFIEAVSRVTTPYIFFLEHDWHFTPAAVPVPQVLAAMEANPTLHSLRYNYHYNTINSYELLYYPASELASFPALRAAAYSNHPSLIRTAKLKRDWLPIVRGTDAYDHDNGRAGGVEESIFVTTNELYAKCGFFLTHHALGTHITGAMGDRAQIIHTGC